MGTQISMQTTKADKVKNLLSQYGQVLWRANQVGRATQATIPTGFASLDRELPGGGWPVSSLVECLVQQPGIGEIQLLVPALRRLGQRPIFLVQPPHVPAGSAWHSFQLPLQQLHWLKTSQTADALWSAEQILKSGTCGALLLWQSHMRPEMLRRLHLAAQSTETVFWLMRPMGQVQDASPAPLRLTLRPQAVGLTIDLLKRRGPRLDRLITVSLINSPAHQVHHGSLDRHLPIPAPVRSRHSTLA